MKKLAIAVFIVLFPLSSTAQSPSTDVGPIEHSFVLHNFHTENGAVPPEAKIVYGTFGQLNAARDNAIFLPSHYMADMHGYGSSAPAKRLIPAGSFWSPLSFSGMAGLLHQATLPSPTMDRDSRLQPSATMWKPCTSFSQRS